MEELETKLRRLMELREARDQANVVAETAEKDYREKEAEIWEDLENSPIVGTHKFDLGEPYGVISFLPVETYYGRVINEDEALEYFESRAMSDEITKPKIVKKRIHEITRERIEAGEAPVPGTDFYAQRYVRITRPKG